MPVTMTPPDAIGTSMPKPLKMLITSPKLAVTWRAG